MKETRAPPLCSAFYPTKKAKRRLRRTMGSWVSMSCTTFSRFPVCSRAIIIFSSPFFSFSFLFPTYPFPPPSFSPLCFRFLCGSDLRQNSSLERLLSTTITPYSAICIIRGTGVVILSSLPNFPRISYFWTRGGRRRETGANAALVGDPSAMNMNILPDIFVQIK